MSLNAIELSIIHWQENLDFAVEGCPDLISIGGLSCALCRKYAACQGCPVAARTGQPHCYNTPYEAVCAALDESDQEKLVEACEDEIKFLESLLPDKE